MGDKIQKTEGIDEIVDIELPETENKVKKEFKKLSDFSKKENKPEVKIKSNDEENWKYKTREALRKRKSPLIILNKYLIIIPFALIILFISLFAFFGFHGNFKSTCVNNNTLTCPVIPDFPTCPSLTCPTQNVTVQFPSEINIGTINLTKYNQTCLGSCLL